jgi:large subunit ribosomal protein L3
MTIGLIGRKLGMTEVFSDEGLCVPVTVIEVEPSVVVQKKTTQKDGYESLQLGYGRISQRKLTKPLQGHMKKADKGFFHVLREFRCSVDGYEVGQEIGLDIFNEGDFVDVVGTTKGKGFAGVIKRHGFHGGRATHGSMFHRAPGSIGASADPSRVFKGTRLPGHMGDKRKTVQNLKIWAVRPELNALLVKGAVPGSKRGFVFIKKAIKKAKED